jgi:RND family efflux transporter MFP subunit
MTKHAKWATLSVAAFAAGIAAGSAIYHGSTPASATAGKAAVSASTSQASSTLAPAHDQLWHCGMHPWVIRDHPGDCPICRMKLTPVSANTGGAHDEGGNGGNRVTIDPVVVQNMGVATAEVTHGPLTKTVRTVGLIKSPEPGLHDVTLKIGGWIDKLYADQEGVMIAEGEPLLELYSQDLQVAEEELISAVKAEKSLPAGADPTIRQEAQNLIESAKRKLRLWDVADADIEAIAKATKPPRDVPFRAPASGHLVEKTVVQGSAVQPGMKLMRIEDHSKMWLDAQVYEEQFAMVKTGQVVEATLDAVPGKTFKGKITFLHPHLDHTTRTITARVTLDNPDFGLRPGMYAIANILTEPLAGAIQAPREAVIDTGTRQIAFVDAGDGHFDPRNVRMGVVGDDGRVQIIDGLAPGERVVTSGQFLIDVESRTTEAIQKLRRLPAKPTGAGSDLILVHCPMKNADWVQEGPRIANPYYGVASGMISCGQESQNRISGPRSRDDAKLLQAYLAVEKSLAADKLDVAATKSLKATVDPLPGAHYDPLRIAASKLAAAGDLAAEREEFKSVTEALVMSLISSPARAPAANTGGPQS